jgi:4-amino-4-deoxy-L-arabinose transferase-like glycosyltransferase
VLDRDASMPTASLDQGLPDRVGRALLGAVGFAAGSHRRAVIFLVLLSLVAFLPGFFQIPPVDRDEARFAQATKQMVQSGDYVDIRFQDEVRYKKPVGIYWLQALAVKAGAAVGVPQPLTTIWLYRIPSLVSAIGAVLLTYWAALPFVSRRGAVLAAAMLAGSIELGVEARLAKTDAVLLMLAVAVMGALARAYLDQDRPEGESGGDGGLVQRWGIPAIFWTAMAGGALIKGPLILMFAALPACVLVISDRSARWLKRLRPGVGLLWLAVLVFPWFLAIIHKAGDSFFVESVEHDMLRKVFSGQESHGAPPGVYFVVFWATFWPAATLAALAAPAVWASRREAGTRFLLAWLVPSWIVFELVTTKLPHYVLPLYPAIAILIAGPLETFRLSPRRWLIRGTAWWFVLPSVLAILGVAVTVAITFELRLLAWPFAAGAVIFGLMAWWLYEADGAELALLRATTASILIAVANYGFIIPSLRPVFPSVAVARAVGASGCAEPLAAAAGYQEPSLVFLVGTETRMTDGPGAADFLREGPCRFALVEARQERAFAQRADQIGLRYRPVRRVDGFNISGGKQIAIAIYRSEGGP